MLWAGNALPVAGDGSLDERVSSLIGHAAAAAEGMALCALGGRDGLSESRDL